MTECIDINPQMRRGTPAIEGTRVLADVIDDAVHRIVEAVQPQRIILFGSAARGEMNANSDVDLLVIMRDGTHRRHTAQALYRHLMSLGFATELVVATESDVRAYADEPSLVISNALREGREVYCAA